jgi:hypothetical protein
MSVFLEISGKRYRPRSSRASAAMRECGRSTGAGGNLPEWYSEFGAGPRQKKWVDFAGYSG